MEREPVRLQKWLAGHGVASRRACADIIRAGRVQVNGCVVTEPGYPTDPLLDEVRMDGAPVETPSPRRRTILLYKPRGYVCSTRGQRSRTVYDLLDGVPERLVPVGRLDKDSEGLLLLSNDGELVNRLTHPRYQQEKVYRVTVSGTVDASVQENLCVPMEIDGRETLPASVRVDKPAPTPDGRTVLEFILREGRNRQIRRLCERAGLDVKRLVRVRVKDLTIRGLKPGQWRDLKEEELQALLH